MASLGSNHASYEHWSYHNAYGNGLYGHFIDGSIYPGYSPVTHSFYRNQPYYQPNSYDANPFLPLDCSDCIFISGLPKTIQKDEIISIFANAGKIKFTKYGTQRIFLFLDRITKDPTGDATVTYESPESAKNAIEKFDQINFNGHGTITVKQALPNQKNPFAEKLRRQSEANWTAQSFPMVQNLAWIRTPHPHARFVPGLNGCVSTLHTRPRYSSSTEVSILDQEANDVGDQSDENANKD